MRTTWISSYWQRRKVVCVVDPVTGMQQCRRRRKKKPQSVEVPFMRLYNTGMGLSDGQTDPNYLVTYQNPPTGGAYPIPAVVFSDPSWTENDSESSWIGFNYPFGVHLFQTSFDLTGLDPNTASVLLEFQIAGDDEIEGIYFNTDPLSGNGVNLLSSDITGANVWHPFEITMGFEAGVNILIINLRTIALSGPTGIRMRVVNAIAEAI